eukprot:169584-Amphidinium_carterae.2
MYGAPHIVDGLDAGLDCIVVGSVVSNITIAGNIDTSACTALALSVQHWHCTAGVRKKLHV